MQTYVYSHPAHYCCSGFLNFTFMSQIEKEKPRSRGETDGLTNTVRNPLVVLEVNQSHNAVKIFMLCRLIFICSGWGKCYHKTCGYG